MVSMNTLGVSPAHVAPHNSDKSANEGISDGQRPLLLISALYNWLVMILRCNHKTGSTVLFS